MVLFSSTYAIQGMLYLIAHPTLWAAIVCPFIMVVLISLAATLGIFPRRIPAQALALIKLAHWRRGPAGCSASFWRSLSRRSRRIIIFAAVPPAYLDVLFRKTLVLRGGPAAARIKREDAGGDIGGLGCCSACCACIKVSIWFRILIAIVTMPIHAVPILGTAAWLGLNGMAMLWEYQQTWFNLYGTGYVKQRTWMSRNSSSYWSAGILMQFLEMLPGLNWVFCWSNAVAAALMCADFEADGQLPGQTLAEYDAAVAASSSAHLEAGNATTASAPAVLAGSTGSIPVPAHLQAMPSSSSASPLIPAPGLASTGPFVLPSNAPTATPPPAYTKS
ncbi:hypothetical protein AMAG_13590 [Allomyces macrogynus ATCC 38327]|uniref:Uncharacterized protein n=1 Tax=Allomyces macrogynus (strain ATCC 38327) TaxID=578462 RepID=A0A0L0T2W3_ALLM3|nr:hypothetical protein AMAG_13590 [Allomyces macrogynus ATCC 38327]|eukprot:KNE69198.1 hypothetical protein AMAG_13590 [Allomyces macrogynus ATCC 38327]